MITTDFGIYRSDREKALELAKRRRAGDKSELTPSDSELEDEWEDSNLEHLSDFEDDDEEVVKKPKSEYVLILMLYCPSLTS